MAHKKLILVSGGPCVGKSTVARKIFEHYARKSKRPKAMMSDAPMPNLVLMVSKAAILICVF